MKAVIEWVASRRYRSIVLAVAFALSPVPAVTSALMALETVGRGAHRGVESAAMAVVGMLVLAVATGGSPVGFAVVGFGACFSGVVIGVLLRRTAALSLAFQGVVLLCFLAIAAVTLVDARAFLGPVIDELVVWLRDNGTPPDQLEVVQGQGGVILLLAGLFTQIVGALLLACWWLSLVTQREQFGAEFRRLALGRVLGVLATLSVLLGLVFDAPVVQNLTPLGLLSFLFQGLAVLHALAHAKRWHPGLVAPVYVLLVTPLVPLAVLALSAVGLVDQWFNLRARLGVRF